MLLDKEKGFNKKGGYCTEFSDKNHFYFNMLKVTSTNNNNSKNNSPEHLNHNQKHNHSYVKTQRTFIKSPSSPYLDKAKEIIEDKNLLKLKYFLIKSGAIKSNK